MKKIRVYGWLLMAGVAALAIDAVAWGGLSLRADIAAPVAVQARHEAPLAHVYLILGGGLVQALPPLSGPAGVLADSAWGDGYDAVLAQPETALDALGAHSRGLLALFLRACYYGGPLCLVLALLGWIFRARTVRLIGGGRS